MLLQNSSLVFKVRRNPAELVAPAGPTPHEIKLLSDLDDQKSLRDHLPFVQIFRFHPSMADKDPVQLIRQALAKTLVFYYPLAGRLRDAPNGKLMVDCTAQGIMFVEADADVTLEQFGVDLHPPFPCFDQLLYNVPDSDGITDSPLLLIQVTRLKCGGLIIGIRMNHSMMDGVGLVRFIKAVTEIAGGVAKPSVLPVWRRELLCARNPPKVTCMHYEYQPFPLQSIPTFTPYHASFFFGPKHIAAIRRILPHHLARSPTFEILTACLWRCYTAALQFQNPHHQEVRLLSIASACFEPCSLNPPIPQGFYGNTIVFPATVSTAGKLCSQPLGYALELVKKAKNQATEEYVRSVADLMATKGRPYLTWPGSLMVSDFTKFLPRDVDYGWGKSLYNGSAGSNLGQFRGVAVLMPYTNSKGEPGKLVLICMPQQAVQRLHKELNAMLNINDNHALKFTSNL